MLTDTSDAKSSVWAPNKEQWVTSDFVISCAVTFREMSVEIAECLWCVREKLHMGVHVSCQPRKLHWPWAGRSSVGRRNDSPFSNFVPGWVSILFDEHVAFRRGNATRRRYVPSIKQPKTSWWKWSGLMLRSFVPAVQNVNQLISWTCVSFTFSRNIFKKTKKV